MASRNNKFAHWDGLKRYHWIISFLMFFIVMGVLGFFLHYPQWLAIEEAEKNAEETVIALDNAKLYLKDLDVLFNNYEAFSGGFLEKLDLLAPKGEGNIPDLIVWLETLASQNGMQLLGIQAEPNVLDENDGGASFSPGLAANFTEFSKNNFSTSVLKPNSVSITLKLQGGSYISMKNFLGNVEESLRLMDVLSFSFSPTAQTNTVILEAYYIQE